MNKIKGSTTVRIPQIAVSELTGDAHTTAGWV